MMLSRAVYLLTPPLFTRIFAELSLAHRRRQARRALTSARRLHLACGKNVLLDWANVDFAPGKNVTAWDLTRGLPVPSDTVSYIYCEHFIEHISLSQVSKLLAECYRCLDKQGVLRLSTPSLAMLVEQYKSGHISEWHDVDWRPETPCQMLNEGMHMWGHQFLFDEPELCNLLRSVGFREVQVVPWRKSAYPELCNLECRPFHGELIVEALK